jgi:hypothetical protein
MWLTPESFFWVTEWSRLGPLGQVKMSAHRRMADLEEDLASPDTVPSHTGCRPDVHAFLKSLMHSNAGANGFPPMCTR